MPLRFICVCGRCGRMRLKIPSVSNRNRDKFEAFAEAFRVRSRITVTKGRRKRKIEKNQPTYFPTFRGTRRKLILPPHQDPCEFCGDAYYNHLCGNESVCLPYNYYMTNKVSKGTFTFWGK